MTFLLKMPIKYRCPICNSSEVIDYEKFIECPHCERKWYKEFLSGKVDKENILSDQELKGFLDAFDELKDDKKREKFIKSLQKDL